MDAFGSLSPTVPDPHESLGIDWRSTPTPNWPPSGTPNWPPQPRDQRELSQQDLVAYIKRNPELRERYYQGILNSIGRQSEAPNVKDQTNQALQDAAENAFGSTLTFVPNDIKRAFGSDLTPMDTLREDFLASRGGTPWTMARGTRFDLMGARR